MKNDENSVKLDFSEDQSPPKRKQKKMKANSKEKLSVFKSKFSVKKGRRAKKSRKAGKHLFDDQDETMRKLATSKRQTSTKNPLVQTSILLSKEDSVSPGNVLLLIFRSQENKAGVYRRDKRHNQIKGNFLSILDSTISIMFCLPVLS